MSLEAVRQLFRRSLGLKRLKEDERAPLSDDLDLMQVMRCLLAQHADVQLRNCAGHSCVMFAVRGGVGAVRLLLDAGAPVDGVTAYGLSALMLASAVGHVELVELLLDRKAEVRRASDVGLTALVMAADKGHAEVVRRLLEGRAEVNGRYQGNRTALMSAAAQGRRGT